MKKAIIIVSIFLMLTVGLSGCLDVFRLELTEEGRFERDSGLMYDWVASCNNVGNVRWDRTFIFGEKCYAYCRINNAQVGDVIKFEWRTGSNEIRHITEQTVTQGGDSCFWDSWTPDLLGNWYVKVFVNEETIWWYRIPSRNINVITSSQDMENEQPIADFSFTPESPKVGEEVTFTSTSTDSDGAIVDYKWTFGDDGYGIGVSLGHTYSDVGIYNVKITVTDDDGATDTKTKQITVTEAVSDDSGGDSDDTPIAIPGFELLTLIGAIGICFILLKRKLI